MGEPSKWEKVKIAIEGIKLIKPIFMAIRFLIALAALYGGSMAYQMEPEMAAIKQKVDQVIARVEVPAKMPAKAMTPKPRLTAKDIQPIVDQAIERYQREHKIR